MTVTPHPQGHKQKNGPTQVLKQAQAMGVALTAANGKLHAIGDRSSVDVIAPLLRQYRDELVGLLTESANYHGQGVSSEAPTPRPGLAPVADKPLDEAERELVEERAAIMEFDAGMEKSQAERLAEAHTHYLIHHWKCGTCCAAGQGRGTRCTTGAALWRGYETMAAEVDR